MILYSNINGDRIRRNVRRPIVKLLYKLEELLYHVQFFIQDPERYRCMIYDFELISLIQNGIKSLILTVSYSNDILFMINDFIFIFALQPFSLSCPHFILSSNLLMTAI